MKLDGIFDGISAVIFDMDGTLIDSMWVWRDIDNEFLDTHGFKNDFLHEDGIEGMSFDETAVYFKDITDSVKASMRSRPSGMKWLLKGMP